jgi:hypothetical protein
MSSIDLSKVRARLSLDDRGNIERSDLNLATILAYDPRWSGVFAYVDFQHGRKVVRRLAFICSPPWHPDDAPDPALRSTWWRDTDDTRLRNWIQREWKLNFSCAMIRRHVIVRAEGGAIS